MLSNAKVKFEPSSYPYNGKPIEPKYTLTMGTATLTEGRDYRRTAKVKVKDLGAYAGMKTLSFKIEQRKVDYKGALVGDDWK